MRDSGIVISTQANFAEVEVYCLVDSCKNCSAKSICASGGVSKGRLTVRNPFQASVGDEVEIKIPESGYNRALILIFSSLLMGSLFGVFIGYLLSRILPFPSQAMIILGFIIALALTGVGLFFYFRQKDGLSLFPVISKIIHKGDRNG
jgi:positive regulator of sigma E activity